MAREREVRKGGRKEEGEGGEWRKERGKKEEEVEKEGGGGIK